MKSSQGWLYSQDPHNWSCALSTIMSSMPQVCDHKKIQTIRMSHIDLCHTFYYIRFLFF